MLSLWQRLPTIAKAIITGGIIAAIGTFTWSLLALANIKFYPGIPWSILPASIFLWLFWQYLKGNGWPKSTVETRRKNLRANQLSGNVWSSAIVAGIIGLIALMLFMRIMNRMVRLPQQDISGIAAVPRASLFFLLLMSAAVAGVVEEASFRGYMQAPIEKRYGPLTAILVTGILFGAMHFVHPETTLALMPFYIGVAAIYGMLAFITNSILPGMVLHAVGNVFGSMDMLARGQSEWQTSATPLPLIWQTGPDSSFWVMCIAFILIGWVVITAYSQLASTVRKEAGSRQ